MHPSDLRTLRQLARQAGLTPVSLQAALECGLFVHEASLAEWQRELRQMRRLMDDLGVNAPGAALLVRMHRELELMQLQLDQLRRLEADRFDEWDEGLWRDLIN